MSYEPWTCQGSTRCSRILGKNRTGLNGLAMHPTGLVDFAVFFFQYPRPCTLLPGEVKLRWRNALFFFWDVSSQALQFACSLSLQAVQLLIGGGSIINQHKYIGLDSVPCKTASFMDVYLRVSAAWMLLCGAKAKSAFFWVQVHPWDWQTRTPIC